MKSSIVPCLWFDDQAEEAVAFYTTLFPTSKVTTTTRYPEAGQDITGKPPGSVMTIAFELAGQPFTALNGGPQFTLNPSISFFVHAETKEETDRLVNALAEGGAFLMPLDSYPWSGRYAWVQDRFGVTWQVMMGKDSGQTVVPCFMFVGDQHGRAEEALRFYTDVFDDAEVEELVRYDPGEGPEETVKHGRFVLRGQRFVAMDAHGPHMFSFNEGISLQVMCDDQAEVDRHWELLSEGGEEGPCGWLKDRFGVSWQIVPTTFIEMVESGDPAGSERAFQAMLGMKKLDIRALEAAYRG
ncbi:MAG: VOC family protein [Euryarchaeota archaeon]|nr:VOC family protein [Euryarchaeota archaeon]